MWGPLAHLAERYYGIVEATGSNPVRSTTMADSLFVKISEPAFRVLVLAFIAILVFVLYIPSLKNGFVYDDEKLVVDNSQISSLNNVSKAFTSCIWEPHLGTCRDRTNYYRPLHTLSIMFTYALSPQPYLFHLINIIYYIIYNFLAFIFLSKILKDRLSILLGLSFFLLHPIHSEAVMWISALPELLLGIFSLSALVVYCSEIRRRNWLSAFLFFLALLSKETAITVLPLIIIYDYLFKKAALDRKSALNYSPYIIFTFLYFIMRINAIGFGKKIPFTFHIPFIDKITAVILAFGLYLKKIILLSPLSPLAAIKLPPSFWDYRVIIGLIALAVFIFLAVLAVKRKKEIIGLGLSIYGLFLTPALASMLFVFVRGDLTIADRYLSLPILGASLILGYYGVFIIRLLKGSIWSFVIIFILMAAGINFSYKVYAQNYIWNSTRTLYEHIHSVNSNRGIEADATTIGLAFDYEKNGDTEKTIRLYQGIIDRKSDLPLQASQAANNLGLIYLHGNDVSKANSLFKESLEIFPYNGAARHNLNLIQKKI